MWTMKSRLLRSGSFSTTRLAEAVSPPGPAAFTFTGGQTMTFQDFSSLRWRLFERDRFRRHPPAATA